ncbi:hypothetical protein [Mesorhizobium carmichaelinearum]|uniref:hypothetical protein n=1 Tax=Mesorhizobium carmichaelinearum TaxID=1208188 RepID=UPI000BA35811|nr:hypothetical protein [Mesorhizobium carmichaelinearum]
MRFLIILPISLMLAAAEPADAQTEQQSQQDPGQPSGQVDKCQVQTGNNGQQQSGHKSLSKTLDDCGGVLKPPATGDQGMTSPPPDEGKTPIIKPGELPAQPPKQ